MKKNKPIYLSLFAFIVFSIGLISCTNENEGNDEQNTDGRKLIECDVEFVENYLGTACCMTGFAEAKPGETLQYEYHSNMIDPVPIIEWVVSGDITIVSGEDSPIVTVKFGDNFTEGTIIAYGDNHNGMACYDGSQSLITKI